MTCLSYELVAVAATKIDWCGDALGFRESHSRMGTLQEMASIDACTERAFQSYLTSPATDWRAFRLLVTMSLVLNLEVWPCSNSLFCVCLRPPAPSGLPQVLRRP